MRKRPAQRGRPRYYGRVPQQITAVSFATRLLAGEEQSHDSGPLLCVNTLIIDTA